MSIAFDPGSFSFRSLRRQGRSLISRRCRSVYAVIPDAAAHRELLQRAAVEHLCCDESLVIPGDAAEQLAPVLQVPCRELLINGAIPTADPIARQVIGVLVEAMIPPAEVTGESCVFTHPAPRTRDDEANMDRRDFIARILRLRGYEPLLLTAGHALILAELARESFTGIGLCLGAGGAEFCVTHCGRELAAGGTSRGGGWIDEQFAERAEYHALDETGSPVLDLDEARLRKEAAVSALTRPQTSEEALIRDLYRDAAVEIVHSLERLLSSDARIDRLPHPLTMVVAGGAASQGGFCDLLRNEIRRARLMKAIGEIRPALDPKHAVTRGCLIHAELEATVLRAAA